MIIGVYDWTKGSSFGSRLVSYDRRTHKQTDLLTSADLASLLPIDPPDATATTYAPELVTPPEISGADLSPDGQRVAVAVSWQHRTGSAEALVEVRVDGSAAPRVLLPATDSAASPIHGLARYSPDGAWLATGGGAISIWSMATGRIVAASAAMPYGPIGLAWSPDGSRLAWGDHFERTMQAQTSVAQLDNPAAPASLAVVDHVAGTTPWWSADGQLRTATAPAFARDVDAARTWVLGSRSDDLDGGAVERSYWWPATSDGADATPLHDLPDGFLALSW